MSTSKVNTTITVGSHQLKIAVPENAVATIKEAEVILQGYYAKVMSVHDGQDTELQLILVGLAATMDYLEANKKIQKNQEDNHGEMTKFEAHDLVDSKLRQIKIKLAQLEQEINPEVTGSLFDHV